MKRSVFLALAAGVIATVAFTAPAQAASQLVTTTAYFALSPSGAKTSEIDFTFQQSDGTALTGITGITQLNSGGLAGLSYTIVGTSEIDVKFTAANQTNGTLGPPPTAGLQFKFTGSFTAPLIGGLGVFVKDMHLVLSPGTSAAQSVSVVETPEPASWALLGIGMTGFLAFRRYFKKTSVA